MKSVWKDKKFVWGISILAIVLCMIVAIFFMTNDQTPGESIETEETGEKIIWKDLDGNGEKEYFTITNAETGTLSLYFNNERIYHGECSYSI